jgi:two-component system, NtrC family, nitrogen regulation response regulator GlnG
MGDQERRYAGANPENSSLDGSTIGTEASRWTRPIGTVPGLTVLAHPDPGRIGHRAPLALKEIGSSVSVSRVEPALVGLGGGAAHPLADRHLSRGAILAIERRDGLVLVPRGQRFTAGGREVREPITIDGGELRSGVVLVLANRVALLLHSMTVPLPEPLPGFEMVGIGRAAIEMQAEVQRVRDLRVPVLLLGETGTGKELMARAIHERGARSAGPFVAVNMAALPPTVAAAELFGAVKGAFTGADRPRPGLIRQATGGTLFLDEIGAMPAEVQMLLLRFLEDHEVRSLGSTSGERVDVRVVAATDSDLERAVEDGRFSRPLLQRFGGYQIELAPLRERKDDLGLLLHHFLAAELSDLGKSRLLLDPGPGRVPWLPAELFVVLAEHSWPGNVRELRNVARRIAIRFHDADVDVGEIARSLQAGDRARAEIDAVLPDLGRRAPRRSYRQPVEVSNEELEQAMRECRWDVRRSAEKLGVSRPSLYNLIGRHPSLRKASDVGADEIERGFRECGGDLEALVDRLQVSRTALKTRLRDLGLRDRSSGPRPG